MFSTSALHKYLRQHPHYIGKFICELCKIWWWRICKKPIVVLSTESGGLGDYLWFRSYYSAIREHYSPVNCRIIVIGMSQWESLAREWDSEKHTNHFDLYRSLESPDNPLKIESLFFKLFKADVYVNFRVKYLNNLVKAKSRYYGLGFRKTKQYYETANNAVINQWFTLPDNFKHHPPLRPLAESPHKKNLTNPYVVFVEGGNTQGKLSDKQTTAIMNHLASKGFNILFNGDYKKFVSEHPSIIINFKAQIFDGYDYSLSDYPYLVSQCQYVVTVNTFIYHLAIQLRKPCVVISANEYESVKLDAAKQVVVFNKELQKLYENKELQSYQTIPSIRLQDIECERITDALNRIEEIC